MPVATMRELLEAGVHYGHHTSRWNPKMEPYIYTKRHSIHIVDLRQTVRGLVRARRFLSTLAEQGGEFLLVGTKKQARTTVETQAKRAGIHYVAERWLGGTLTNFHQVMSRVRRLEELENLEATGQIEAKGKKLASVLRRDMAKLRRNLGGIRNMKRVPDAMIIIDPRREKNALREAQALDIPTICFLDTDSDPEGIDIVIPGNDDAMRSIQLVCSRLMDAIIEGRARAPMAAGETAPDESTPSAEAEPPAEPAPDAGGDSETAAPPAAPTPEPPAAESDPPEPPAAAPEEPRQAETDA